MLSIDLELVGHGSFLMVLCIDLETYFGPDINIDAPSVSCKSSETGVSQVRNVYFLDFVVVFRNTSACVN